MAWMAYQHGDSGGGYFLAVIGRDGTVTRRISVPQVLAMASGADGNLWFVGRSQLGRVTPAGAVTLYPFQPEPEIEPCCTASMTRAPDGNVWFTADEFTAGRVTPRGEIILANTPGAVSLGGSGPAAITAGRCTIWFTELGTLARVRVSACSSAPPARVPTGVVTATAATSPPTSAAPGVVDTVPPQPGLPAGQAARPTKRVPTTGLPLAATIAAVTALAAAVALTGRRLLLARRSAVSS